MNSTRYQIVNRIARGGVGQSTWCETTAKWNWWCAKSRWVNRNQEVVSEAGRLRSLRHPGLPWVYDCGIDGDGCFLHNGMVPWRDTAGVYLTGKSQLFVSMSFEMC